ncbi:MAG: DNA starvation/stationary phase protection protein [Silanimonas sp.]|nr:MAG: DNA starvation/stationary phase protection protein [Silanimonas sp.]
MAKSSTPKVDNGITAKDRRKLAEGLSALLADSYTLYLKTHAFHWNVTGPMFNSLHAMFMTQYNELWMALDEIAERIRALDHFAPGSGAQFAKLASVKEESGVPDWRGMVEQLVEGHDTCARTARRVFKVAEAANDQPTCDLLTVRLKAHEKAAWMLRALLE